MGSIGSCRERRWKTVEKRKENSADPMVVFIGSYTLAAVFVSIAMGAATAYWIGLIVYAIAALELVIILIIADIRDGGRHGL